MRQDKWQHTGYISEGTRLLLMAGPRFLLATGVDLSITLGRT